MKFIRVLKAGNDLIGWEKVEEGKGEYGIVRNKQTGKYRICDPFMELESPEFDDIASAEKMLEDMTEDLDNAFLYDLAQDLLLDLKDVQAVNDELSKTSMGNSGYGKIGSDDISDISGKTGISENDIETIALELGYTVE